MAEPTEYFQPVPLKMVDDEPSLPDVPMDERIAQAVLNLSAGSNGEDWAFVQHYVALKLIKTRDLLEQVPSKKLGGYANGLRFLFELRPRAEAFVSKASFKRSRRITGEEEFVTEPMTASNFDEQAE